MTLFCLYIFNNVSLKETQGGFLFWWTSWLKWADQVYPLFPSFSIGGELWSGFFARSSSHIQASSILKFPPTGDKKSRKTSQKKTLEKQVKHQTWWDQRHHVCHLQTRSLEMETKNNAKNDWSGCHILLALCGWTSIHCGEEGPKYRGSQPGCYLSLTECCLHICIVFVQHDTWNNSDAILYLI